MSDEIRTEDYLKDDIRVFVVPVEILDVPDLTIYEQMIYVVLRSHCSARNLTAFPSYATLAREARMSRRQAIRAVESLIARGLIERDQQFRVTKNKQIQNSSNLYTLRSPSKVVKRSGDSQSPGVVSDSHQGGDSQSPGVVSDSHQGGDSQSPKQNHLTDPLEQIHNNNTVAAVQREIESCLGVPIPSLVKLLPDWIERHGSDKLVELAKYIGSTPGKWDNIVGTYRSAVTEVWDVQTQVVAANAPKASKKVRDERYSAFYDLFPDA